MVLRYFAKPVERKDRMRTTALDYYERMWDTMVIVKKEQTTREVARIQSQSEHYQGYSVKYLDGSSAPVPWVVLGVLHELECDANLDRQLFNGQRWNQKTTIVPQGKGPWKSFRESTEQYVQEWHGLGLLDSVPKILQFCEKHNGLGYARKGVNSPYLWAGSNHGVGQGHYVADGKYDPKAESRQIGIAPLLSGLLVGLNTVLLPYRSNTRFVAELQDWLNRVSSTSQKNFALRADGIYGPKTLNALRITFGDLFSEQLNKAVAKEMNW